MSVAYAHITSGVRGRRVRTGLFLLGVLLINYTLGRPSPVDVVFVAALAMTAFCHQSLTTSSVTYMLCAIIWGIGVVISSSPHMHDPDVELQVVKITYAISISFVSCLTAIHWRSRHLRVLFQVWIVASCIAAALGVFGFATDSELLTWDGRAKGLLDDPNMYGAFLLPGAVGALYFTMRAQRRWIYAMALTWLSLGVLVSFSRVAIAIFFVLAAGLLIFLNRANVLKVIGYLSAMAILIIVVGLLAAFALEEFNDKVADRLTLVKEYDGGDFGRLNRYFIAWDYIISNPLGLGTLQFEKMYVEGIHNIWLSSFMNYGWGAGFAWTGIMLFAVLLSLRNYHRTRDELFIILLLSWCGVISCALLHEAERWRHLWLLTGLIWGMNLRNWAPAPDDHSVSDALRAYTPGVTRREFGLRTQIS